MITSFGMMNILAITGPIFTVIGIGYLAVKLEWFPKQGIRTLGQFVIQFALPAMLFKAISEKHLSEIFDLRYLIAYTGGSFLAFCIALWVHNKRGQDLESATIYALGSSFSNSGFIGFPIVMSYLGYQAMVGVALTMVVENVIMLPLILAIADHAKSKDVHVLVAIGNSIKGLAKNILVLSVALGIVVSLIQFQIPAPVGKVIDMLASASGGVALFAIGAVLVGLELRGRVWDIGYIALGKLILHPLMVALLICCLPTFDRTLQIVAIVLAGMPMMSIYSIIGQKYDLEGVCAASLLLATSCSFMTITGLIWLTHNFG